MEKVASRLAAPVALAVSGVVAIVAFARMAQFYRGTPLEGPDGVLALQLSQYASTFRQILADWGPDAVELYRRTLWVDFAFAAGYGMFLAGLAARVFRGRTLLFLAGLGAGLFDWVENALHWAILGDPASCSEAWFIGAFSASLVKWGLVIGSVAGVAGGAVARVARMR